jgi:hypothetical protein
MARVLKPGSIFNKAYQPLDTGPWKTRVLDANLKMAEQWTKPEVVAKSADLIGGIISNYTDKRKKYKASQERLRASEEGQAQLKATDPAEIARIERDRINKEAVLAAQQTVRRGAELEGADRFASAQAVLARAKAQDWKGRATMNRAAALKRQQDFVDQEMKKGYGSLAQARGLAAAASHEKDPKEALRLRKEAAIARTRAYDAERPVLLSEQAKFDTEQSRRDLKELFPPIMRDPNAGKKRGGRGGGPKGAHANTQSMKAIDAFRASPVKRQIELANSMVRSGYTDRNTQMTNIPAGFGLVTMDPDQIAQFNVPSALVLPDGQVMVREFTRQERDAIGRGETTQDAVMAVALRDAVQSMNMADNPSRLQEDTAQMTLYGQILDTWGAKQSSAFRGVPVSLGSIHPDALKLQSRFGGLGGAARPLTATSPGGTKPPDNPITKQQEDRATQAHIQKLMRMVQSKYQSDAGLLAAKRRDAQVIIQANPNVSAEELLAQLEQ